MNCARRDFYTDFIQENTIEQRELFRAAKTLFNKKTDLTFPDHRDSTALANDIGRFFVQKIERIRSELDATASPYPIDASRTAPTTARFDSFDMLSEEKVKQLISKSSKKSSSLDPIPTPLIIECIDVLLPVITRLINLSLESGLFPDNWKHADVRPRL